MIRRTVESIGNAVLDGIGRASSRVQERRPLPVDLLENDDAYLAVFDAPGAAASDVQVRFDHDTVHVRVDRFREFHEGFEMRFPGRGLSLDGEAELPADAAVDPKEATATLATNGTLRVRVPKTGEGGSVDIHTEEEVAGDRAADEADSETGGDPADADEQPADAGDDGADEERDG